MSKLEKSLLIALFGLAGVYLTVPASSLRIAIAQFALTAAPAAGAVLALLAARRGARGAVPTWLLLAAAAAAVAVAQVLWTWRQLVLNQPMPFPSASFYLFLAFHPLFAAALILSLREGDASESRREIAEDALLACATIALVLLRFVFEPLGAARPWLTYTELVWIIGGQFLAQLSLVATAVVVIWRRTVLPPRATAAIIMVALVNGTGNLLQLAGLDPDAASPGDAFDLVWLTGWLFFIAAGAAGGSASATAWTGRTAAWLSVRLHQAIAPLVTLVLTGTVVDIAMSGGAATETVVMVAVVGGLVAVRLVGTIGASARAQLKKRELERTRVLVDLNRTLAAAPGVEDALSRVAASVRELLPARRVWIERINGGDRVCVVAAQPPLAPAHLPVDRSLSDCWPASGQPRC